MNAIFGKEVGLAKRSLEAVTTNSTIYYCKLENGNCVSLVDTPGLSDTNRTDIKDIDNIHLEEIQKEKDSYFDQIIKMSGRVIESIENK